MTSHRKGLRQTVRRRIAAAFAVLCVAATLAEVSLPDLHDGDATVSHVAGAGTHEEPSQRPVETPQPQQTHAVHVDHCAHAHVFAFGSALEPAGLVMHADAPVTATPMLASVTASPNSRPPIA